VTAALIVNSIAVKATNIMLPILVDSAPLHDSKTTGTAAPRAK
jgi:hypothetical protein